MILTLIFVAVLAVDISAIIMTSIMIIHVKRKYTAVGKPISHQLLSYNTLNLGRKEMVIFLYGFMLSIILELVLITGIIPMSQYVYKVNFI